jgi:RHS repeat-associated protein/uncharacterized repeat protein (TIGR01451 family)
VDLLAPLTLGLTADPAWAAPGDVVSFTVVVGNAGAAPLAGVTLTDTLPDGLVYVAPSAVGFSYDPSAKQLTWPAGELAAGAVITGGFQARVQGLALGATVTNTVRATSPAWAAERTAQAVVTVAPPAADEATVTAEAGGWLRSPDGRTLLRVPAGAVRQPTLVRYRSRPAPSGLLAVFALAAATDESFGQPAELRVRIAAPEAGRGWGQLRLLAWDAAAADWQALPTTADPATGSLATTVYGGGVYAAASGGPTYGVTLLPSLKAFTSELWSGAAQVGYDLDAPVGPAGLGLNLRLAYNSQGSNILEQVVGSAYQAQASWAGLGWELAGIGSISRPLGKTGPYRLSFGGGAFEIKANGAELTTDPQGFLKIEHSGGLTWNTQPWTVRTPDGLKYTFGNPSGVVGGGTAYEAFWTGWGADCSVRATQWGLTKIEDPAGNRWDVAWAHETKGLNNGCGGDPGQYTRSSYPETLTLTPAGGAATVRVRLVRESRNDKNVCKYSDPYQVNTFGDGRLKQVFVEAYTAGAWQLVRRYDLGYTYDSTTLSCGADPGSGNHSLLTSITQYGANGTSALPAYTLGYQGSGNSVRLKTANNGYGGAVQFNYGPQFVANNAGCTSYQWQVVTSQVITNGTASGLGLFATTVYTPTGAYAYVTPVGCNNGAEIPRDTYEFLGHTAVQEVVKDAAGQAVTQRSHSYSFQYLGTGWWDIRPDPRKGKATLVVTTQPGGSELARTATEWLLQTVGGVDWPYTNAVTQTQGSASAVTRYAYTTANQNGGQYGNVTHVREYASASAPTPCRTTERWYYPRNDASAYIVNRAAQEKLWDGDTGGACKGQTRSLYDSASGYGSYTTPPTKGFLTEVWQAKTCDSANQADWVRSAAYSYDPTTGNRTGETNAAGATTTTAYDTTFKTYPITQTTTPGAGGGATQTTSSKYYGVNAEGGQGSGLVGQLQSVTDPNAAVTRLTYDVFGRVTEIRKPGAGWANPATEKYAYTDSPAPLAVKHSLRDDANDDASPAATYLEDWTYYDGLGQVIQTQREAAASNQNILVSTQYHPLGGVRQQNVPYFYAAAGGTYRTPDWGQAKTQTAYDALGRVTLVTHPDSTTTETRYTVEYNPADPDFSAPRLAVYSIDANRRFVRRASDVFGNLRSVSESTGSWPVGAGQPTWGSEYRTRYSYDVAGRLLTVQDHAGNQTTLTYDLLGRKTALSDPDMGVWSYAYDAAGNLVRQTDARNQRICFYYDGLSRLKGKTYSTGAAACPTDTGVYTTTYSYDAYNGVTQFGLGRRTAMTDASGSTSWLYDGRGRVITATQVISSAGGGTFVTAWGYDSADRLRTLTYPDGEVVTTTYTAEGQPKALIGRDTYVGDTAYTALGQVDLRRLGSTAGVISSDYVYRTDNFRLQWLKSGTTSPYESLQKLEYAYDAVGNVDWIKDWKAGSPQMQDYTYDALHRLTNAVATGGSSGTYNETYTFNEIGNLLNKTGVGSYAYNAPSPASGCVTGTAATKPHAAASAGSNLYRYDCTGNVISRTVSSATTLFAYDAENRLTGVSGAATAGFLYDGDGNRVQTIFGSGDGAAITTYVGRQVEISPTYREDFGDGLAQGWTSYIGAWVVNSGGYRPSAPSGATNAYRSQTQNQLLVYQWQATYTSGTSAGLYLFASTATGAERGNSYRIWQDATHVRIYENASDVATLRASFAAANAAGQTHSYQVIYDPLTGKLQAWRDRGYLGEWTDTTPLTSGSYLSLRTDSADVRFDDLVVSEVVKYYEIGGQRVAVRKNGAVSYLFGDHLGSTSVTANASGTRTGELWYKPWGEYRGTPFGTTPTTYRYTGQREDASVGLYYYGARYYAPALGRFYAADTLVPGAGNPQALNRYSYTLNNPLKYNDPTGHWVETAFDVLSLGMTINDIRREGLTFWNAVSLVTDVASVALPIVPAGASHAIRAGKLASKAINAADTAADAAKLLNAADTAGDTAKLVNSADDVARAASKPPIVIGENMRRVKQYAAETGGHAYRPWKNDPFDADLAMRRNARYMDDQMRQGREIVDIGPDFNRRNATGYRSPYYEMERKKLNDAGYSNYRKVFTRNGKSGGVRGLDYE